MIVFQHTKAPKTALLCVAIEPEEQLTIGQVGFRNSEPRLTAIKIPLFKTFQSLIEQRTTLLVYLFRKKIPLWVSSL